MSEDFEPYVVVIGAATIDSKGRSEIPLSAGSSTPGVVRISVGGVARNVADNLARLGTEVSLLSAVGSDGSGQRIMNNAEEVGIDTDSVLISDDHNTAAYLAVFDEKANLVMSVDDMKVLDLITPAYIEENRDLLEDADFIFFDSNLPADSIERLVSIAKENNVRLGADTVSKVLASKLEPYLADLYMITPNAGEAEVLSGKTINNEADAVAAARSFITTGVEVAIVNLGERGAVYASDTDSGYVPAVAVEVVDTTGAGDALTGTVLFGLLNDISLVESVRLGASAASLTLACTDTVCEDLSLDLLYDSLIL